MVQGVEPGGEVLWQNNVIFILSCPMSKLVKFMYVCMYVLDNYRICSVAGILYPYFLMFSIHYELVQ